MLGMGINVVDASCKSIVAETELESDKVRVTFGVVTPHHVITMDDVTLYDDSVVGILKVKSEPTGFLIDTLAGNGLIVALIPLQEAPLQVSEVVNCPEEAALEAAVNNVFNDAHNGSEATVHVWLNSGCARGLVTVVASVMDTSSAATNKFATEKLPCIFLNGILRI